MIYDVKRNSEIDGMGPFKCFSFPILPVGNSFPVPALDQEESVLSQHLSVPIGYKESHILFTATIILYPLKQPCQGRCDDY